MSSKRPHAEVADGPSPAQLSQRVNELSMARLRELVLAAAGNSVDFALQVMQREERLSQEQLAAKTQSLCRAAEQVWHSLDRLRPSQQFEMSGQICAQFESSVMQQVCELAPDDELHILTELADAAADPECFEGEVWKTAIGGCGGGIVSSLAERIEAIVAKCDIRRIAACVSTWKEIAGRLADYGMDDFDALLDLVNRKSEPIAPSDKGLAGKGHYAVFSGIGKGTGGYKGQGRGRGGR
jgi:hypothetical protein